MSTPSTPIDILIVEDNVAVAMLYTRMLRAVDATVRQVETCQQAKDAISTRLPDIVFLDMTLPDGNGRELVDFLRDTLSCTSTTIIVITGHPSYHSKSKLPGVQMVLSKPASTNAILDAVKLHKHSGLNH